MNPKKTNNIIKALLIFILVLGLPSFIALNPSIYFTEAKKTNAEATLENASHYYKNVHEFLVLQKTLKENFTENEESHMRDVRFLFNTFKILTIIFLTLIIIQYTKVKKQKKQRDFIKSIHKASIISTIILITIIIISILSFNWAFDAFHKVFFPQGNWIFPHNSILITLFPETFFINTTKKIILITLTLSVSLTVLFYILEKKIKK